MPSSALLLGIEQRANPSKSLLFNLSFPMPSTFSSPRQVLLILADPTQRNFFFWLSLDEQGALLPLPTEPGTSFLSHLIICVLPCRDKVLFSSASWASCLMPGPAWAGTQKPFVEWMIETENKLMNGWGKASKASLYAVLFFNSHSRIFSPIDF